ncbi:hypothetical protein, partial [Staphylococcus aureus]|uniref:hypothetical protein n=1 Tax=Staphylococcus aureus TaxID=1280 RepID=UPI00289EFA90
TILDQNRSNLLFEKLDPFGGEIITKSGCRTSPQHGAAENESPNESPGHIFFPGGTSSEIRFAAHAPLADSSVFNLKI